MPVDTYPNIPADEMDEAMASQLPDEEMEDSYIEYVMDESLNEDEQDYLADVLQGDPRLSDILDKVITTASEFSGAGEVDGPGTGVSDSIPARLSDGEFVFTKKATDQIGADQLQTMMDDAERAYDGGSDAEMEEDYISYVMDESLNDDEQDYLVDVLQKDPRLSDILDKVITTASEFSGAGEVEGPGTGVSDSIPARLSDGEFVFTKKATDQIGADQLQTMMDDAERAYDGGLQAMAEGGMMEQDEEETTSPLNKTDEEIKKLMMGSNRMPSLR